MVGQLLAAFLLVVFLALVKCEQCSNQTVSTNALVNQINLQLKNGQFECNWPNQCCQKNGGTACCTVWYFWVLLAIVVLFVAFLLATCVKWLCCSHSNSVSHEPPPTHEMYGCTPPGMTATNMRRKSIF